MLSPEEDDPETVARATLSLLETRLRRLEFLLTGGVSSLDGPGRKTSWATETGDAVKKTNETVTGRLQKLQSDLENLRKVRGPAGDVVRDIESLHFKAPEIFQTTTSSQVGSTASPTTQNRPDPLVTASTAGTLSTRSTVVLSHATLYPTTASQLSSLQSLAIPNAASSGKLVDLRSRIDAALHKQLALEAQSEELRNRSAKCLEWWVQAGVVGMGELWEDWEGRVKMVDRDVRRLERIHKENDGHI